MLRGLFLLSLLLLAACRPSEPAAPPRATGAAEIPVSTSRVTVPISASLSDLEAMLNAEVPEVLQRIDQQEQACIPAQHVNLCLKHVRPCKGEECRNVPCKLGTKSAKISPSISCRIVGEIRRGRIHLSGEGERIHLRMPVSAEISANDVGHILSETATAKAEARANIRLDMTPQWRPIAKVDIDYSWTEKPGIELLGQRVTFASRADPHLKKIIADLERSLPAKLERLQPRARLEDVWKAGFTTLELNARNPEVWMRVTPRRLDFGGYQIVNGRLLLKAELEAGAETFVGSRPEAPRPTPLPNSGRVAAAHGFLITAPVIADYAVLEPVLWKALNKLAKKPIEVPGIGPVNASFGPPTIYAIEGGQIALGLTIKAARPNGSMATDGKVWLTGTPYNEPNSPIVKVRNLKIAGESDRIAGNLVFLIAQSEAVTTALSEALAQNFSNDIAKLKVKIDKALTEKKVGDFVLDVQMQPMRFGVVQALPQGAYLPVEVSGTGSVHWYPHVSR
ncbi:DUF4403 family protein [Sandaracinobacter neustonicus]|uniref:DUF4403 family protein n=1 Tax=Sandaracinobacter neustonicus TaxID=1715348 RepID=A0A501XJE9_9SPHN|nr:DUF4403 family protein [Sandaracinobacter neustonicus]TPE60539.1 DUF4403 family protein [Sandaracinobacter neustonicus]